MHRMKRLNHVTLKVVLAGSGAAVPMGMRPTTGILVWQDVGNVAVWDGGEWTALNSSGWTRRFGVNMPVLQVASWAIISSPRLAVVGGECFRKFTAAELLFAFHAVAEEDLPQDIPESPLNFSERQGSDPGRDDIGRRALRFAIWFLPGHVGREGA